MHTDRVQEQVLNMNTQVDRKFLSTSNTRMRERERDRERERERERWTRSGGARRREGGAGARGRHDSDGGGELRVGEEAVRRRRRSAWEAVPLGPPPALSGDGSSRSGRRGGRRVAALV